MDYIELPDVSHTAHGNEIYTNFVDPDGDQVVFYIFNPEDFKKPIVSAAQAARQRLTNRMGCTDENNLLTLSEIYGIPYRRVKQALKDAHKWLKHHFYRYDLIRHVKIRIGRTGIEATVRIKLDHEREQEDRLISYYTRLIYLCYCFTFGEKPRKA